jgi:hypothetical protein
MLLTPLFLAVQVAAALPPPSPPYAALASPTLSARYAWDHGCLEPLRSGTDLTTAPNPYIDANGSGSGAFHAYRMTGAGKVSVVERAGRSCMISVSHGDAKALRAMVLEPRRDQVPWRPVFRYADDVGVGEVFCGDIGGQVATLWINTFKARRRPSLNATVNLGPTARIRASPRCEDQTDMDLSRIPDSR